MPLQREKMKKDDYCSFCGSAFPNDYYPKTCLYCNNITYNNPLSIVVSLISVREEVFVLGTAGPPNNFVRYGALVQKRAIEPKKDQWAFCGGYINAGESWQEAVARELQEEVGLTTKPEDHKLYDVRTATNGNILIFTKLKYPINWDDLYFSPNEEVSEIKIIYEPIDLAFLTHTEVLNNFIKELKWC